MRRYRASQFNHLIPLESGKVLAYNALSRALRLLEPGEREALQTAEPPEELAETLVRDRFLVPDDLSELGLLRALYNQSRFRADRMTLTVMPTTTCNFGCDYCFQGAEKPTRWMSAAVQDEVVGLVGRTTGLRDLHVAWYGGEPLLGMPVIRRLSARLAELAARAELRFSAMAVTNGYRLDRATATELADLSVRTVQITLDGPCELHDQRRHLLGGQGTYDKIVGNLRSAVEEERIQFRIRINVDGRNAAGITGLLNDLAAQGLGGRPNLSVYPAPVESMTEDCHAVGEHVLPRSHYSRIELKILAVAQELGLAGATPPPLFLSQCAAIKPNGYVILPDGDVHKCWDTVSEPAKREGNLLTERWPRSPQGASESPWLQWTPFADATCAACSTLPLCAGRCAYHFVYADDVLTPDDRPCPSWKHNLAGRLLQWAVHKGLASPGDRLRVSGDETQRSRTRLTPPVTRAAARKQVASRRPLPLAIR